MRYVWFKNNACALFVGARVGCQLLCEFSTHGTHQHNTHAHDTGHTTHTTHNTHHTVQVDGVICLLSMDVQVGGVGGVNLVQVLE